MGGTIFIESKKYTEILVNGNTLLHSVGYESIKLINNNRLKSGGIENIWKNRTAHCDY